MLKDLHLGRSSRSQVESSSSNGPFFLFCFNNSLGRLRFLFFFSLSFLLIRMSCDLLYLRGGGRGWNSDAVAGYKDFLNDSEAGDGEV